MRSWIPIPWAKVALPTLFPKPEVSRVRSSNVDVTAVVRENTDADSERKGQYTCRTVSHQTISRTSITTPMPIIIRFSVSDTKPRGTFEPPPTQAHLSSRLSI